MVLGSVVQLYDHRCRSRLVGANRRFFVGTGCYAGVVVGLVLASWLTQDTAGPALYVTAGVLTLPAGVFSYPALWVNVLLIGLFLRAQGLAADADTYLSLVGVVVIFFLVAVANALLARQLWRARKLFR